MPAAGFPFIKWPSLPRRMLSNVRVTESGTLLTDSGTY